MLSAGSTGGVTATANGFFVSPVRSVGSGSANLVYDSTSKEIYVGSSSRRYKTDIADISAVESARVWDLRPVSYRPINVAGDDTNTAYGFIAEEVEEMEPRLVFYGQNEEGQERVEGVNYDMVIPLLLQEMKAMRAQIAADAAAVAELRAEVKELKQKLTSL